MKRHLIAASLLFILPAAAQEPVDLTMVTRIRHEGFRNSKVMETGAILTDRYGPRLTGSENLRAANEWARKQLEEWGLANARLEEWQPQIRAWKYDSAVIRVVAPINAQLVGIPKAWSIGTNGAIRARVARVNFASKEEMEKHRGKLAGMIVLNTTPPSSPTEGREREEAPSRYDETALRELGEYRISTRPPQNRESVLRRRDLRRATAQFLADEKAAALIEAGTGGEGGTFDVSGTGAHKPGEPTGVPTVVLAREHFGRINRLLDKKVDVELELDVRAHLGEPVTSVNTIAEIPGSDKAGEIVMVGAHIDSWHGGTGATDNAAGTSVAMEAVRILKALGIRPRRTIRVALWSGEEQGLFGSNDYVKRHVASRPEPTDADERDLPVSLRRQSGPLTLLPEHSKISAYYNLDNGTGKIRGIYAQENAAVVPIFRSWIEPLQDLGVTVVTMRNTGGTDHVPFDAVGVPGFQFVQDDVKYRTLTHHSNTDVYEQLQREDLMQASVVMATFLYHTAMREQMLPRKPLPPEAVAPPARAR